MTIRPEGTELLQADMTELIVAFRNFANALKNSLCLLSFQYLVLKVIEQFSLHFRILCHGVFSDFDDESCSITDSLSATNTFFKSS